MKTAVEFIEAVFGGLILLVADLLALYFGRELLRKVLKMGGYLAAIAWLVGKISDR